MVGGKWLEGNVLSAFVYVFLILVDEGHPGSSFLWNGRLGLGWAGHLSEKLAVKW